MDSEITKELLKIFNDLLEKASDRNSCLTELAKGRTGITDALRNMAFNPNDDDYNGNQSKYKIMKEQADKIDDLIRAIAK